MDKDSVAAPLEAAASILSLVLGSLDVLDGALGRVLAWLQHLRLRSTDR